MIEVRTRGLLATIIIIPVLLNNFNQTIFAFLTRIVNILLVSGGDEKGMGFLREQLEKALPRDDSEVE
ncbi:MAG: hypothetical protein ACUVQY_09930 [Thermoproteota archaeon]